MWIQTYTGEKFNFSNPTSAMIHLIDIAEALSKIVRFTGHTKEPYTVAQHSYYVMKEVKRMGGGIEEQLWALLHDATEAYIGDINRPLKFTIGAVIKEIEHKVMDAILDRFDLHQNSIPAIVKEADEILLHVERRDLLPAYVPWGDDGISREVDLSITDLKIHKCWGYPEAYVNYSQALSYLLSER